MKIINAITELGSFTLIGNKIFIASSKGMRSYKVTETGLSLIRTQLLEAEYDDTNVVKCFTAQFITEGLPEELSIVHPAVLQEVFALIVLDLLEHGDEIKDLGGVWYRNIK